MANNTEDVELREQIFEIYKLTGRSKEHDRILPTGFEVRIEALVQQEANRQKLEMLDRLWSNAIKMNIDRGVHGNEIMPVITFAVLEAERKQLEEVINEPKS